MGPQARIQSLLIVVVVIAALSILGMPAVHAELPTGYLVWSKGKAGVASSRKIFRMTLPDKSDIKALTRGEDVSGQISPDGKWVAYAKAKLSGGSDYHRFNLWKVYIVSIHGVGGGRREQLIAADGYWPTWGKKDVLYYNKPDGTHTQVFKVTIDGATGRAIKREPIIATKDHFGVFREVNECAFSSDDRWFAARSRGPSSLNGVSAYQLNPPRHRLLARAGSVGCMPYVAPNGEWALIAGATHGIRWGHSPYVTNRKVDQLLIAAKPGHKAYHPGVSTDGNWVMASHGKLQDHNAGAYDLFIYALDTAAMTVSDEQVISSGGFNGWPHLWVGIPTPPPMPRPRIMAFYPSQYTLAPREEVSLRWVTHDADQVTLDGQPVAAEGSRSLTLTKTTSFSLVARSSKTRDRDSKSVEITVNATPQAVRIDRFVAQPETIDLGAPATLSWAVRNATTLDLTGARVAPSGEIKVSPEQTTEYVLVARGHQGPAERRVKVTVRAASDGLLPDRGGFVCALGSGSRSPSPGALPLILLFVLLGLARSIDRDR